MTTKRLILLDEVKPEPITWLWTDRIPLGVITLIESDGGVGKTAIHHDLTSRITTGRPMPITGNVVGPAGAVLLQGEDHLRGTVRPALEAAGADLKRIRVYDKRDYGGQPLLLPGDVPVIEQAIEDLGNVKLVVIDPLSSFVNGSSNSERTVRDAFGPLASLAERKGIAIVIVRHWTRDTRAQPKHRGSGSASIIAAARSALMVLPDPENDSPFQHILAPSKGNLADWRPAGISDRDGPKHHQGRMAWQESPVG